MVSVLAFDSAGHGCSAAVLHRGRVASRRSAAMERGQAEALMPMIEAVLAESDLVSGDLDLIAVTVGPGSFTGLRIALATAQGLALATGRPLLGITNFAAMAAQVRAPARSGRRLVVALDSKRKELYLQSFDLEGVADGEGALVAPEAFATWVPEGPLIVAGDGAPRLAATLGEPRAWLTPGSGMVDAADVARLAAATWRPGVRPPRPRPLYLRAPDTTTPHPGLARP
ncbi:MAG TPA: tRNA (adenosine(37)-N6)-threonylcarbamoyltransferase complex dimerization subunit type 1 TsaB [Stellaceae bacterium]|jgi:tRNA threonylcarbamoyladenosine biosynthesis protein TsaB|nr:tRNA (adenosine(37)-N6)-threonylcarbamoyltransferase complex dimerization subunit type 1 TsaB [Stellaceae bacterium]